MRWSMLWNSATTCSGEGSVPGRRAILTGGLALAAAAGLPRRTHADAAPVLVIGAGIAGLAAARELRRAGQPVMVIEARARLGGRLQTSRLWPDRPVDLGASWIHGLHGNPVAALAREAGIRVLPQEGSVLYRDRSGAPRDDLDRRLEQVALSIDRARSAWTGGDAPLSQVVGAYLDRVDVAPEARAVLAFFVRTEIEQEFAADWDDLSAWWFDSAAAGRGPDGLVPEGFDRLAAHLAQGLDIRLNTAVQAIRRQGAGITLEFADGGRLSGRAAVVTVPLGVLKSGNLVFDPPLSASRQTAIDRLGMGVLNKLVLRFERAFWPRDTDWLGLFGARRPSWASLLGATGAPILMGLQAGGAAVQDETRGVADLAAEALEDLRHAFGSSVPAPHAVQATRWRRDPFAQGSYSFHPPGSAPDDRRALSGADWQGRLVFAGEATDEENPSTVHGALASGLRAARAV